MSIMKEKCIEIISYENTYTGSFCTTSLQEITGNVSSENAKGLRFVSASVPFRFDMLIVANEEEKEKEFSCLLPSSRSLLWQHV